MSKVYLARVENWRDSFDALWDDLCSEVTVREMRPGVVWCDEGKLRVPKGFEDGGML